MRHVFYLNHAPSPFNHLRLYALVYLDLLPSKCSVVSAIGQIILSAVGETQRSKQVWCKGFVESLLDYC